MKVSFRNLHNPKKVKDFDLNNINEFDLKGYGWVRNDAPIKAKEQPKPIERPIKTAEPAANVESDEMELPTITAEAKPTARNKPGRKPATRKTAN